MKKTYERIKNFSTSVPVQRTIAEIEMMLAKYGASKIMKDFDKAGNPSSLSFLIATEQGEIPIKLPLRQDKMLEVFKVQVSHNKLPKKYWGGEWAEEQAHRVGWRIIKDWLDAQLTLLGIQMVKVEEIFLPYMYDAKSGKTMFELLEEKKFNFMQLGQGNNNQKTIGGNNEKENTLME